MASIGKYTQAGIEARRNALANGTQIKLATFKISNQHIDLTGESTVEDLPSSWITKDITSYRTMGRDRIEFELKILDSEATNEARSYAVYLEDGTPYIVGVPANSLSAFIEQKILIQVQFINSGAAEFSFVDIPAAVVKWEDVEGRPDFEDAKNNLIPSQNLLKDSFMIEGTTHYGASGSVTIEAVHPYTKGFEGPSVEWGIPDGFPNGFASNADEATEEKPILGKGTMVSRGGLADGWNGITNGNILKIVKPVTEESTGFQSVFFTSTNKAICSRRRFRAYIKIVKGRCSFGEDAGYHGVNRGYVLTKELADTAVDGWYPLDIVVLTQETVTLTSTAFCMGFDKNDEIEIYLAVPELSIVSGSGTNMQIINNI